MAKRGHNTASISTEWAIEVFDWRPDWPLEDSTGDEHVFFGNSSVLTSIMTGIKKSTGADQLAASTMGLPGVDLSSMLGEKKKGKNFSGIVGLDFSRSKSQIDGQCVLRAVGPIPKSVRVGNWAVVSSIFQTTTATLGKDTSGEANEAQVLPRFVGQIHSINTSYSTDGSGNIRSTHNIMIREWSSLLHMPIKFDLLARANLLDPSGDVGGMAKANASIKSASGVAKKQLVKMGLAGPDDSIYEILRKFAKTTFNPYQFAKALLWICGGISKENITVDKLPESQVMKSFWDVAMTMPSVPTGLLDRLGFEMVSSSAAFQEGFLTTVAGRQQGAMYNDGKWDGIFKTDGLHDWVAKHNDFDKDLAKQPQATNMGQLAQIGNTSIWDMIYNSCDPAMNDIFTDIIYEERAGGGISAKPVLYVRGKPFRTKKAEQDHKLAANTAKMPKVKEMMDSWPLYENLPRILIAPELIMGMNLENTLLNTPTYIRPEYHAMAYLGDQSKCRELSMTQAVRLDSAMRRFGGSDFPVKSTYFGTTNVREWAATKVWLGVSWHADNYRTASGSLTLKDHSIPFAVGLNIQFKIGNYLLVAHIESINSSFSVSPEGIKTTVTTIRFSRLMGVTEKGALQFLPAGAFTDMFDTFAPISETPDAEVEEATGLLDLLKGMVGL